MIPEIINYNQNNIYKQAIINGNFDIWQRGTNANISGGINTYLADRWLFGCDGTLAGTYSRQSFTVGQTDVPNNPKYFARIQATSASGQTYSTFNHKIEGVETFAGMKITLSLWAKSDVSRSISIQINQYFGSGGSPSASVVIPAQTINLTTSWAKYVITYNIPSINGKTKGTGGNDYLNVQMNIPINTAFTFDIAQVQINAGLTALPFMPKTFSQELQDCLRYFEKSFEYETVPSNGANATSFSTTAGTMSVVSSNVNAVNIRFQVTKRAVPSMTKYGNSSGYWLSNNGSGTDNWNVNNIITSVWKESFSVLQQTVNGFASLLGHWTADAEL